MLKVLHRVVTAQLLLLAPAFSWPFSKAVPTNHQFKAVSPTSSRLQSYKASVYLVLATLTAFSVYPLLSPKAAVPIVPLKQGKANYTVFNAGIWTVHFGFDNEGHDSQRGMRELIRDMDLDVVGLLETDLHRTAFGHRDL